MNLVCVCVYKCIRFAADRCMPRAPRNRERKIDRSFIYVYVYVLACVHIHVHVRIFLCVRIRNEGRRANHRQETDQGMSTQNLVKKIPSKFSDFIFVQNSK